MSGIELVRMMRSAKATNPSKSAGMSETLPDDQKVDFSDLIKEHGQKTPTDEKQPAVSDGREHAHSETAQEEPVRPENGVQMLPEAMLQLQAAMSQLMGLQGQETLVAQTEENPQEELAVQPGTGGVEAVLAEETADSLNALKEQGGQELPVQTEEIVPEGQPVQMEGAVSQEQSVQDMNGTADADSQAQPFVEIEGTSEKQDTSELQKDSEQQEKGMLKTDGSEAGTAALTAGKQTDVEHPVFSMMKESALGADTVKTTPETFPQDIGTALAAKLPSGDGTLTIELEPASLGKMTIKVMYEGGKAAVSILASSPKTLEMLSQNAGEIARILEERTGQETMIYTPEPQQQMDWDQGGQETGRERQQDSREDRRNAQSESFAQQLRLGLI